jgi:hypothetical protein
MALRLLPYLPMPISAGYYVYKNYNNLSLQEKELKDYNTWKLYLRNTALAIAGCVVYSKYAEQLGAGLIPLTFVACSVFPEAAKLGTSGYFTVTGALGLVDAARKRDVTGIAKNLALTIFAYVGTTRKMDEWAWYCTTRPFLTVVPPKTNDA